MAQAELILGTLEKVAERVGDPSALVYERLFAMDPSFEALFVLDTDGGVRGNMLETSLTCLIGVAENELDTPRALIQAAHSNHDGYGVDVDKLDLMFTAIRDSFRDLLADDWTPETEAAWTEVLDRLASLQPDTAA